LRRNGHPPAERSDAVRDAVEITTDYLRQDPEPWRTVAYSILGHVAISTGLGEIRLPKGRKQRLLLAALLLHAPRIVSTDRLCEILWGAHQPEDPEASLRTQVSRLRAFLRETGKDSEAIRSAVFGYRLLIEPEVLDAGRFELLLRRARALEGAAKLALLDEALALWRGEPFEEFADLEVFLGETTRLRELHAGAREARVECLLAAGRISEALAAVEELVYADPLRERPRALLMEALYRAGRQHDALSSFQQYRRLLSDELGLDPSPALRRLESEILRHERETVVLSPEATVRLRQRSPSRSSDEDRSDPGTGAEAVPGIARDPTHAPPPVPLTRLIGRETEMASVRRLLQSTRLLTLTGAGGSGKTRLALELAAHIHADAEIKVAWVGLEGLADARLLSQEVAAQLGVREQPGRTAEEVLLQLLEPRRLLLCVDNCEHLIAACAHLVERLLGRLPRLTILTTSREPLGIPGELTWPVPPLPVPNEDTEDPDLLRECAAVRLFAERASAADPRFEVSRRNARSVAQVCRRLDGMPLALELAAARVRTMPVEEIVARLDRRFLLLNAGSRTALPRHQTLRAAIDWSYELLSEPERQLLEQLSVFAGGFTLSQVEAVCESRDDAAGQILDMFAALVDKSLVIAKGEQRPDRYRLLETIREYARERLEQRGEGASVRQRHAAYFTALAEEAEPNLLGGRRREWIDRLSMEQDNLRAALHWTRSEPGAASLHLRLAAALWWTWHAQGHISEARDWTERALLLPEASQPGLLRARVLYGAAMACWIGGEDALARRRAEEGLELARSLDDARTLTRALSICAWMLREAGDLASAIRLADECVVVARRGNLTPAELAFDLWLQGSVHSTAGNLEIARNAQQEAAAIWRAEGVKWGLSQVLHGLAIVSLTRGELEEAERRCREALLVLRDERETYWTCRALEGLAAIVAKQGEVARAAHLLGAAESLREPIGAPLRAFETPRYQETVSLLREKMSEADLSAAWARGRTWSLEQALEYALAGEDQTGVAASPVLGR
jgi:predicted ATPase/DNA-binding SARP family transcriptional activator